MLSKWVSHLPKEERPAFEKYIRGSKGVIDRLQQITKDFEDELDRGDLDPKLYDSPGWAAKQADSNGYRRCLRKYQHLFNLDQKED